MTQAQSKTYVPEEVLSAYPVYTGNQQGVTFADGATAFRIWSPGAQGVKLRIYDSAFATQPVSEFNMKPSIQGTWLYETKENYSGKYYTFSVNHKGTWLAETPGIWAKAVGINGNRAAIIDMAATNPDGWENDRRPELKSPTDIIIYEMHHRDFSIHPTSGIKNKGKYLALTENGTKNTDGLASGIDHLKDLGVTHVHILPSYDYGSVDEAHLTDNKYNWGYDPKNYNVPDGSYSNDPGNPALRIKEFKEMVQNMHKNGLRVILDVVYNHTFTGDESNFSLTAPGYFYRYRPDGTYSDASACGNETASEREMMRRYMIESILYWAKEYHIDGFRFDLMGIHDIETMNMIREAVNQVDPTIYLYGEGWTASDSPLPVEKRALKAAGKQMPGIAVFSDDIRDGVKGHYSQSEGRGFATGQKGLREKVKFGIVGATSHPQVDYAKAGSQPYASMPADVINYVSCHDDMNLVDKLKASLKAASPADLKRYDKLAQTIVFTSQGVPFIFAGEEVFRDKKGIHNTYQSPDSVNAIDWSLKAKNKDVYDYYKALIALRKAHPAFRMTTEEQVAKNLVFAETKQENVIQYQLNNHANGDEWKNILVIFNGNDHAAEVTIPAGKWTVALRDGQFDQTGKQVIKGGKIKIERASAIIAYQK
ncbi:MAG: type I pullulanase [Bacteroidales bacterium]